MKYLYWTNLLLLVGLSVSTGLVKLGVGPATGVEADLAIFAGLGFGPGATAAFGAIQLVAGVALVVPAARRIAAIVLVPTFCVATAGLFVAGVYPFAPISILFIAMALWPGLGAVPQASAEAMA